jgi:pimeloyl-ACP methyl ester carboxylesterase
MSEGVRLLDGLNLFVCDEGEGPPVLLLHGFPFTHHTFRAIRQPLARRHRVVSLDLPGFGDSDRPGAFRHDVVGTADAMAALLRELGAAPAAVVAHGFSAAIATAMAVLQPWSVRRLVLVAGTVYPRSLSLGLRLAGRDGAIGALVARLGFSRARLARHLRESVFADAALADEELVDRYWEPLVRPGGIAAARRVLLALGNLDPIAELPPRVSCPALVVWGNADRLVPPDHGRRLASEIPNARFASIAQCGHSPHEERPDEFLDAVTRFLDED